MNVAAILTGWGKALGFLEIKESEAKLSKKRMKVCGGCEHAKHSKFLQFFKQGAANIDGLYCSICSCPCHEKSLTKDVCPLGKWDNIK